MFEAFDTPEVRERISNYIDSGLESLDALAQLPSRIEKMCQEAHTSAQLEARAWIEARMQEPEWETFISLTLALQIAEERLAADLEKEGRSDEVGDLLRKGKAFGIIGNAGKEGARQQKEHLQKTLKPLIEQEALHTIDITDETMKLTGWKRQVSVISLDPVIVRFESSSTERYSFKEYAQGKWQDLGEAMEPPNDTSSELLLMAPQNSDIDWVNQWLKNVGQEIDDYFASLEQ